MNAESTVYCSCNPGMCINATRLGVQSCRVSHTTVRAEKGKEIENIFEIKR